MGGGERGDRPTNISATAIDNQTNALETQAKTAKGDVYPYTLQCFRKTLVNGDSCIHIAVIGSRNMFNRVSNITDLACVSSPLV
jgi:hypothetical protein